VEPNSPDFCSTSIPRIRPQSEKWCCWLAAVGASYLHLHLHLQFLRLRFVQSAPPLRRHKQPLSLSCLVQSCPVLSCPILSAAFFRLAWPSCPRVIPQQKSPTERAPQTQTQTSLNFYAVRSPPQDYTTHNNNNNSKRSKFLFLQ
jgi:hypothetical protein